MKALPVLLIGIGLVGIVTTAVILRNRRIDLSSRHWNMTSASSARPQVASTTEVSYAPVYEALPTPASDGEAARAIHEASVRSTLIKYRTAVVRASRRAQESLLASLKKNEELAVRFAEQDLKTATKDSDRKSILAAIEAIRR